MAVDLIDFFTLIILYRVRIKVFLLLSQIHFITLNSSELKKSIIAHCIVWQTRLGELLRSITEADIDVIYAYVEKSSEEAMKVRTL